jgi:hypothetical protein
MEGSEEQQPGWVLQSMVPSVLLHGRKIHLRTYVIALRAPTAAAAARTGDVAAAAAAAEAAAAAAAAEAADCQWPNSGLEFYAYQRHEVRLAAAAMSDDLTDNNAHLTTGVWRRGGVVDDRTTLVRKLRLFCAFLRQLIPPKTYVTQERLTKRRPVSVSTGRCSGALPPESCPGRDGAARQALPLPAVLRGRARPAMPTAGA